MDIFWAGLMALGFALALWLLFVVLRDVFDRDDLSAGAKVAWTVGVCLLPVVGSLVYLGTRGPLAGELRTGWGSRRRTADIYR